MIACFLKKVHEQNQKKIGKNMVFWSCTLSVICYKIIKELETHDYRRKGESNGARSKKNKFDNIGG